MTLGRARGEGGRPDVILLDTRWDDADFLAYQLAKRNITPHSFTPLVRRPRYLPRAGYPYGSIHVQRSRPAATQALLTLVRDLGPACIIPCTEAALYWVWSQPAQIQDLCVPKVPPGIRPLLLDRGELLDAAARRGVPVPEALTLSSKEDCLDAASQGLPLVVKAARSVGSEGVRFCRTPDDVLSAFVQFSVSGEPVTAQRYYTGGTFLAGGLFVHGKATHFYTGQKTAIWPKLVGPSIVITSVGEPRSDSLLSYAETVCQDLDWTGLASFDFVLDEDKDLLRMVDFNPRHWGAAGATVRSGVALYDGLAELIRTGAVSGTSRSEPGVRHRVFPRYTFAPSGISRWRRLAGLRDAPWADRSYVLGELAYTSRERLGQWALRVLDSKPASRLRPALRRGRGDRGVF